MLHAWNLVALAFCAILASLSLLRGIAGLIAVRTVLGGLESVTLGLGGLAGWVGIVIIYHGAA